jgi:hypothetical protein
VSAKSRRAFAQAYPETAAKVQPKATVRARQLSARIRQKLQSCMANLAELDELMDELDGIPKGPVQQ